jgi:endogenous inhibitor of DNA gyrase (YacG/DUF329 family)
MPSASGKLIIDREMLNTLNEEGCPACGRKFTLGDTAVVACGAWGDGAKVIQESEAVFDARSGDFVERRCFRARRGSF